MPIEVTSYGKSALGRTLHPNEQCPHPALQEPGLERAEHGAGAPAPRADPLPEGISARRDNRTSEDVTVAIQVFRGRVNHEISAELDGTCQDRGRRGAVDSYAHVHGVGNFCHGREVRDIPHWIGGRLYPQEARTTGADGRSHLGKVRGVDELDVEPPRDCELR